MQRRRAFAGRTSASVTGPGRRRRRASARRRRAGAGSTASRPTAEARCRGPALAPAGSMGARPVDLGRPATVAGGSGDDRRPGDHRPGTRVGRRGARTAAVLGVTRTAGPTGDGSSGRCRARGGGRRRPGRLGCVIAEATEEGRWHRSTHGLSRSAGPTDRRMIPRRRERPARPTSAVDDSRSRGASLRTIGPVLAADHDVLDPRAVPALEVDAGLHAERHPRRQRLRVARDEVGLLVALEPDPVARPVEELRAVARRVDDPARDGVDRARTATPGPDRGGRLRLGRPGARRTGAGTPRPGRAPGRRR